MLDFSRKKGAMNTGYKYFATSLMSLALANGWVLALNCPAGARKKRPPTWQSECRSYKKKKQKIRDCFRLITPGYFSANILAEASMAGLIVMSTSKVSSRTNQPFTALQQNLTLEATEPQLLHFFRSIAAANSPLRIQSLAVRPTPDRSRLLISMAILGGDYRLPADGQSREPNFAQTEYLVLSQRRHLRQAALDCYTLTKSTLPSSWQLENLQFQDGKRLSAQGQAPAEQVRLLEDVRT